MLVSLLTGFYFFAPIYLMDIAKRGMEFSKLKHTKGNRRIYKIYRGSYCQRSVVISLFPESREYYRELGYRFYNIFPDAWIEHPLGVFSWRWWASFFSFRMFREYLQHKEASA